jgi:hypothetical protein
MAQYNNKDQRNLEELLEEKWFDRFKARGAEALGSAKGLGQQIKGGFQQAAGSALSKAGSAGAKAFGGSEDNTLSNKGREFSQQGQRSAGEGSVSGHNAKVKYLQQNIDKRIQSFVDDIKNDIKKLGLDIGNIEMVSGINAALGQLKKSVSGATPPPLPQSVNFRDDDNGDFKYDVNLGDDVDAVSTTPTKKSQKNFNYDGKGFDQQTDLSNPSNMTYSQGKVNYDDVDDGYTAAKEERSNRAKQNAAIRKQNKQIDQNPKKSKVGEDPFAKHMADEQEEDLDKMFWDN